MQPGEIVAGKYRLNRPLGSGGMAEVWSATNTFTERQVAIKFMNAQVAKTPEAAARFLNEAKVTARVNHPNIIDILDVGQTEQSQLFLVMELLTGLSLDTAIRRQTPAMSLHELAIVMIGVADALAAAHRSGVIHRDLKPTNIYLHKGKDGILPKLLDFGVSKFLEEDTNHALTVDGTVLGSPLYMSPEQARGESQLDGRTDVFSFGAILYEAVCGYRAYEAKNFNALIVKIATTKPKDIDTEAPNVPEAFRAIVRGCMETDPKRRFATFEDIATMLREAMPTLEASDFRLPMPASAAIGFDPDATNALPVVRASDRPITIDQGSNPSLQGIPSALATSDIWGLHAASAPSGSAWQTPNTSYASVHVPPPPRRSQMWLIAAGAALVLGGIGIGAVVVAGGRSEPAAAHVQPPPAPVEKSTGDTPTLTVDALPGASSEAPLPKGSGRLSVAASPGACALTIDGTERGLTPVASVILSAGVHQLACKPSKGKPRVTSVTVPDGATSKYRFAFED